MLQDAFQTRELIENYCVALKQGMCVLPFQPQFDSLYDCITGSLSSVYFNFPSGDRPIYNDIYVARMLVNLHHKPMLILVCFFTSPTSNNSAFSRLTCSSDTTLNHIMLCM